MTETELQRPVAIVGGGPVGLMLALFLDRHGVASVVFNSEPTVRIHPKGSTHNSRTMEHYRRLGFSEAVRKLGLPPDHPTDSVYLTRFNGHELTRLKMPSESEKMAAVAAASTTDQIPEPIHRANQMYVEQLLFAQAAARPNVTLRFGWRVDSFAQDASGVTLRAIGPQGQAEDWRALYAAGCDGGRSFVRRTLGIAYEGHAALDQEFFGQNMVSTYFRAPTLYRDFLGQRRAWQYWIVNPELRTAVVALDGGDEFILWSRRATADGPIDDNEIADLVRKAAGADIPVEIVAHGPWTGGVALHAERFGEGRVWLAGDAIHLFTPTGGFGMNTGIDDVANLAWKLAASVQGWGGPKLIASYASERKPIAVRNTTASRALAKSIGDVKVPRELEDTSPEGDAARREVGAFLSTFGEEFASIGVQLGARYDGSPIVCADDVPPPQDSFVRYVPSAVPGGRAPHVWTGPRRRRGDSLFDALGAGFTLLRLGAKPHSGDALVSAAKRRGIPLAVLDVPLPEARKLYGRDLALIRPDQHVAWRGDTDTDAEAALARVTGC